MKKILFLISVALLLSSCIFIAGCYTNRDLVKEHHLGQLEAQVGCAGLKDQATAMVQQYQQVLQLYSQRLKKLGQLKDDGSLVPLKTLTRKDLEVKEK